MGGRQPDGGRGGRRGRLSRDPRRGGGTRGVRLRVGREALATERRHLGGPSGGPLGAEDAHRGGVRARRRRRTPQFREMRRDTNDRRRARPGDPQRDEAAGPPFPPGWMRFCPKAFDPPSSSWLPTRDAQELQRVGDAAARDAHRVARERGVDRRRAAARVERGLGRRGQGVKRAGCLGNAEDSMTRRERPLHVRLRGEVKMEGVEVRNVGSRTGKEWNRAEKNGAPRRRPRTRASLTGRAAPRRRAAGTSSA
jgi:hypothetical protein